MRRLNDEGGAVAVVVALLLVVLLGFAAVGVDTARLYAERRVLQNGADAAALAIAQTCADGACDTSLAADLIRRNDGHPPARASVAGVSFPAEATVRVRAGSDVDNRFAAVLDPEHGTTAVAAEATAAWGAPAAGPVRLPMTVSWCEFAAQTGGGAPSDTEERTIAYRDPGEDSAGTGCHGPSGLAIPGGFGWLETDDAETCGATTAVEERAAVKPGNSVPRACSEEDFAALRGETLLLPVYDEHGGQGRTGWIEVHGYAAFTLTGYRFSGGHYNWNSPCSGSDRCISGYFTSFVAAGGFEVGPAPALGANVVRLVPN